MNVVSLIGRLVKDLDLRYTQSGKAVATGTLAVNRRFKNASGENEADFIQIQIWDKSAENLASFTRKGSLVGITGRIQTRNYENKEGQRVYVTEVVAENFALLESKKDSDTQQAPRQAQKQADPFASHGESYEIDSDSLPF